MSYATLADEDDEREVVSMSDVTEKIVTISESSFANHFA
jgi:hypothetical protein